MGIGRLSDGLAPTPPMGWNSWNRFGPKIDETLVLETAEAMVTSGMRDAGYRYVVIDEEDIKKVAPKTAKTMEVLEFVKSSEVDPVFFESSYYLAPEDAGVKPYALLFEALRKTGCVGLK